MTFRTSFEPKFHTGDRVRVTREILGGEPPLGSEWTVIRRGPDRVLIDYASRGFTSMWVPPDWLEPALPGVLDASAPTCDSTGPTFGPREACSGVTSYAWAQEPDGSYVYIAPDVRSEYHDAVFTAIRRALEGDA